MDKTSSKRAYSGSKTRQQIAEEYNWSVQTLRRRLKAKKITIPSGLVGPKSQMTIYEALGCPPGISKQDYRDV